MPRKTAPAPGSIPASGKAYAYRRASTLAQAQSGLGLEAQEAAIRAAVARQPGLRLIEPIATDEAVSGSKPLFERPAGAKLNAALRPGDQLIVARADRLFRRASDCLACMEAWQELGLRLTIVDFFETPIDLSSHMGQFILSLFSLVAQLERSLLSERVKGAHAARKARNGPLMSGKPRYGYRRIKAFGKYKDVPDWNFRRIALWIRHWRESGWTELQIRIHLRQLRVPDLWAPIELKPGEQKWVQFHRWTCRRITRMGTFALEQFEVWAAEATAEGRDLYAEWELIRNGEDTCVQRSSDSPASM